MKMKKWLCLFLGIVLIWSLTACGDQDEGQSAGSITIASKNFTENIILAHIMATLIENQTDINVVRKVNLGGSNVAWKALQNNEIQLYPDYTGTIVANYYQQKTGTAEETLASTQKLVEQDNLRFLQPFGFNNTYTLAVKQETANKYNLNTFSDLAKVADQLSIGCEFEFIDRPDGLPGLQQAYNMNFKEVKGMDHGIMYRAINEGQVDVIDSYSTDGQLKVFELKILEDDKAFFPPYHAGPIIRQDTLEQFPQLEELLNQLGGKITPEKMQELNALVDAEGYKAEDVAEQFLVDAGLITK
jgi:osmoprotectant transport system substrate-binding protein